MPCNHKIRKIRHADADFQCQSSPVLELISKHNSDYRRKIEYISAWCPVCGAIRKDDGTLISPIGQLRRKIKCRQCKWSFISTYKDDGTENGTTNAMLEHHDKTGHNTFKFDAVR